MVPVDSALSEKLVLGGVVGARQALAGATPPPRKKRTFPAPHGNIIETGTVSYRLAHARAQLASR